MSIWTSDPMACVPERNGSNMIGYLGIEAVEAGEDYLKARMPVTERTRTPAGVLHGGASVVPAETLATWGAPHCVDAATRHTVGLDINANHVRPVSAGFVYAVARPLHLGRATQIWEVRIADAQDRLVCISRVTMAVLETPSRH